MVLVQVHRRKMKIVGARIGRTVCRASAESGVDRLRRIDMSEVCML